ncbi:SdpI family protein [Halothermothrix orenii]|uniref:Predicted integral membrane protein n=1 Tax=Halothermothrix orenii (strain H 168 / OCM 544 / DSM 9562) TaxID=373903 RepID=B8D1G0_HALOH|nr:SdpI family protein [Halothermothrix orenii]ACL69037.1 predicted integral membrane protein [Halothermothrix orenii H 168]
MKKYNIKRDIFAIFILLVGVGFALASYPKIPDKVPIQWGLDGNVNSYANKFPGAFWGVFAALGIYIFFYLQLIIDPLKKNYERFKDKYWIIRDITVAIFVSLNFMSIFWSLGYMKNNNIIILLISILIIAIGNYMPTFKKNWFLGIKTPWTLSSEEVWNKTHRLGGKLFVLSGLIGLIEILFFDSSKIFLGSLILTGVLCLAYSFIVYKKMERKLEEGDQDD